jgi:hypothetical protein
MKALVYLTWMGSVVLAGMILYGIAHLFMVSFAMINLIVALFWGFILIYVIRDGVCFTPSIWEKYIQKHIDNQR